ncbi:MAG TPA: hypothetical protein VK034_07760 [Enhygromyxa sp.]|nr:hypothetical protein [Enhygromyxa sp.]
MPPNTLLALAPSLPGMSGGGSAAVAAALSVPVAGAIYFLLTWGKRSAGECSWRDDDQIGLKVIVGTLIMVGTVLFAFGLQGLLHLLMTFKEFVPRIKAVLPDLLVGVVVVGGAIMFAVPKTNHSQHPKALRLTAGAIALVGAVATVINLDELLKTIFQWPSWHAVAGALTSLVTSVVVFGGSGYLYAKMIGVEVPDIPLPAEAQQLQQQMAGQQPAQAQAQAQPQQGYQQPQQGYQQPQQGGYQQPGPGGGYPPQPGQGGGGYPPPGGGPYGQ